MSFSFFSVLGILELLVLFLHGLLGRTLIELFPALFPYETYVGVVLFILGWTFVLSTFLTIRYYNWFTRISYYLASVWMGFFYYYLFAIFFYSLMVVFFHEQISEESLIIVGRILFLIATGISLYGLVAAHRISLTRISVALPNLPHSWKGKKLAFISDIHLGQLYGASFAQKIVAMINNEKPDLVCVGGDLYDGAAVPKEQVVAPFSALVSRYGTYFVTGNHEEYDDVSKYISSIKGVGMRVLLNEKVELDGIQLLGVDYKDTVKKKAYTKILTALEVDKTRPSILLKHTPRDMDVALRVGVSMQFSGHTHKGQMFPLSFETHYMYRGFDYGLKKFGSLFVYTSSGVGTWGPPMRVGAKSEIVIVTFI